MDLSISRYRSHSFDGAGQSCVLGPKLLPVQLPETRRNCFDVLADSAAK